MTGFSASPAPAHRFSTEGCKKVLTVDLPSLDSLNGVDLDIGDTMVRFLLPGRHEHIKIPLPADIAGCSASPKAKFSKKNRQLTVAWEPPSTEEAIKQNVAATEHAPKDRVPETAPLLQKGNDSEQPVTKKAVGAASAVAEKPTPASASVPKMTLRNETGAAPAAAPASAPKMTLRNETSAAPDAAPASAPKMTLRNETNIAPDAAPEAAPKASGPEIPWIDPSLSRKKAGGPKSTPCLEELEEEVEHILKQCTIKNLQNIRKLRGIGVILSDFEVEGEANANTELCTFNVAVSFRWEAMDPLGGSLGVSGSCEVKSFTHESISPDVLVKVPRNCPMKGQAVCEWMKGEGAGKIAECLNGPDIATAVAEGIDVDDDDSPAPGTQKQPTNVDKSDWAKTWFSQRLSALKVVLFGGAATATLSNIQVSGNASVESREGQPCAEYKLQIECSWSVAMSTPGARGAEGSLNIPEFSVEKGPAKCEVLAEKSPDVKCSGQLVTGFKQQGVAAVRTALAQFVDELA